MSFSQENGYIPVGIDTIMLSIMDNINTQFGTAYTIEVFEGTNLYKYLYAAAQKLQENEIKTSEIFLKLQQFITLTNEKISRPVVTSPGLIEKLLTLGYIASVKPMIDADAGKINVCVDVLGTEPDYAAIKLEIATVLKNSTVAGAVTQGTQVQSIALSNGQSFDFKYHLPDRLAVLLKLTVTLSENNQLVVGDPDDTKLKLLSNIANRYQLGKNFEPQKYFSISDAPWASAVKLEWSINAGANYYTTIFNADFDELFDVKLENITLIED